MRGDDLRAAHIYYIKQLTYILILFNAHINDVTPPSRPFLFLSVNSSRGDACLRKKMAQAMLQVHSPGLRKSAGKGWILGEGWHAVRATISIYKNTKLNFLFF